MYTYLLGLLAFGWALVVFAVNPWLILFPAALIFGWTQIAGPCGTGVIGAVTPLVKGRRKWRVWVWASLLYTCTGLFSSAVVGGILGWASRWLRGWPVLYVFVVISGILTAREAGWISFPLPERRRETEKLWVREFGTVGAATMWGFHIGFGFGTCVNYGGVFALIAAILAGGMGNPMLFGALVMGTYWLGRALSMWLAPTMCPAGGTATLALLQEIRSERAFLRRIHALTLAEVTVGGLLLALQRHW
jgi:hypothetical protein